MASKRGKTSDKEVIQEFRDAYDNLLEQMGRAIVGQKEVMDLLLICIFSRGHGILEGVPGLAKTLMVRTVAEALSLSFNRIQFTPDLMPSDITGTEILEEDRQTGAREFRFVKGPVFAQVILADEINRTPPKTQASLLEAMQERQVTYGGERFPLEEPFFVLATQNPIEQEGTYPLPEAQQDRFMFKIIVDYPTWDEEMDIMKLTTVDVVQEVKPVLSAEKIMRLQHVVRRVPIADHVIEYAMKLVRQTRLTESDIPDFVKNWLSWGAGPRAVQYLILGGKAGAILNNRYYVSIEDVQKVAKPVLRHRLITNFNAASEGISTDDIVQMLLDNTPVPQDAAVKA